MFASKFTYYYKINNKYSFMNNFLTGAIDIIKTKDLEKLRANDFKLSKKLSKKNKNPLLNPLIERGYYYINENDENKLFHELFKNYKKKIKKRPIKIVFCPSYVCNLKCTYCFEKDLFKNKNKFISDSHLNFAFNVIEKFLKDNKKISSIELFGGEPLLPRSKESVKKILNFAYKKNIRISIITNGVLANEFIGILKPVKNLIDMLQITIDGPLAIHDKRRKSYSGKGSFSQIEKNIDLLLKNKINTNIRVNIDMENIDYLPELYEFIDKKNWVSHPNFKIQLSKVTDHKNAECVYPIVKDNILLEKLISIYNQNQQLEKTFSFNMFKPLRHILYILNGAENVAPRYFNCESNLIELYIFCPDGFIYTCPESIGDSNTAIGRYYPDLEFFENNIKIWTERNILKLKECSNCKFAPLCGGGCPYSSILIHKNNLTPVCEDFQDVLDTYLKFRGNEILKKYNIS